MACGLSASSTLAVAPAVTVTCCCCKAYPIRLARSCWIPAGTLVSRKFPSSPVSVLRSVPTTCMVTPDRGCWVVESITRPVIVPVFCAATRCRGSDVRNSSARAVTPCRTTRIDETSAESYLRNAADSGPCQGSRGGGVSRPMLLTFLVAMQTAPARETAPVLEFPTRGLDDSAAYEGYSTRLYRDSRGNTVQIYIDAKSGRVVHVLADGLNESIGFTARDTAGNSALAWGPVQATVGSTGGRRWLRYSLAARGEVRIGQFLLGSMRIERDFGYAGRVRDSLNAPPFVPPEFTQLADRLDNAFRDRLTPRLDTTHTASRWMLRVAQTSLDGKNHLSLTVSGDRRRSTDSLNRGVLRVRPIGSESDSIVLTIEIATDGPALHPLARNAIFTPTFRHFGDSTRSPRIEREIRGFELLSSREKLMAGLPNYATYFGRDMFMTALLMQPVWSDTMAEFVMAAALAKLGPSGDVSHEEALGGQAIRENAAEFLRTGDTSLLRNLQRTRENYWMVDDDFQLPVVAGRYFANAKVPAARKRQFVARWGAALRKNLADVAGQAAPYARDPSATNLAAFQRDRDGC